MSRGLTDGNGKKEDPQSKENDEDIDTQDMVMEKNPITILLVSARSTSSI